MSHSFASDVCPASYLDLEASLFGRRPSPRWMAAAYLVDQYWHGKAITRPVRAFLPPPPPMPREDGTCESVLLRAVPALHVGLRAA